MKINFILLIIIFSFNNVTSQILLEGKFELKDDKNYYTPEFDGFDFSKDTSVIVERWTDIGTVYGKGKYFIEDDKMKIVFESTSDSVRKLLSSSYKIIEEYKINDSLIYNLNISNYDSEILEGAIVLVEGNVNNSKYVSDENGNVSIRLYKDEIPVRIRVSYISYETLKIDIKDKLSKKLNICLKRPPSTYFNSGEKLEYEVEVISEYSFSIKSEYENIWLRYRKVD